MNPQRSYYSLSLCRYSWPLPYLNCFSCGFKDFCKLTDDSLSFFALSPRSFTKCNLPALEFDCLARWTSSLLMYARTFVLRKVVNPVEAEPYRQRLFSMSRKVWSMEHSPVLSISCSTQTRATIPRFDSVTYFRAGSCGGKISFKFSNKKVSCSTLTTRNFLAGILSKLWKRMSTITQLSLLQKWRRDVLVQ